MTFMRNDKGQCYKLFHRKSTDIGNTEVIDSEVIVIDS